MVSFVDWVCPKTGAGRGCSPRGCCVWKDLMRSFAKCWFCPGPGVGSRECPMDVEWGTGSITWSWSGELGVSHGPGVGNWERHMVLEWGAGVRF